MPGFGVGYSVDMMTVSKALKETDRAFASSLKRELRKAVTEEGATLLAAIKAASSWSTGATNSPDHPKRPHTSIAAATKITVTLGTKSANVRIRVDKNKAPHARPYDGEKPFRHPVFARTAASGVEAPPIVKSKRQAAKKNVDRSKWTWTTSAPRPFFFSTIGARDPRITKRFNDVLDQVVRDAIQGRQ